MSRRSLMPLIVAGGVGVVSGLYIWRQPMQELTGHGKAPGPIEDGRSQAAKDGATGSSPSANPRASLRSGGATPVDPSKPTVAGRGPDAHKTGSADHDVKIRDDAKVHDGTGGGGVGVAEMRERKMKGQGLPSPQGGDTKPQAVDAVMREGEGGGIKKQGRWWLGGW